VSATYNGFENLAGKVFGTIRVIQLQRRQPVAWSARCDRCGSSFILNHDRVRDGVCPRGVACGRTIPPPSPSIGRTVTIGTGIRAAESASAREYTQHQPGPAVTMRPITAAALLSADPDTLARFIDHQRGSSER
jgi:hypothetical protein